MNLNHKGRANVKVKVRWLVLVKIYGNNPKKLLNKINENNEIKINEHPFNLLVPKRVLNSLNKVKIILFHKKLIREGRNQKEMGIIIKPINVLNQFKEKLKIEAEGSKTENKLVIIFSLKDFYYNELLNFRFLY